jgi:hypothetical protein
MDGPRFAAHLDSLAALQIDPKKTRSPGLSRTPHNMTGTVARVACSSV